ncbi:MAG: lysophospholipase L1-like esterase, partial [Myxococcota bacterium]
MRRLPLSRRLLYAAITAAGLMLIVESAVRMLYRVELGAWASPAPAKHEGAPTLRGNPYLLFEFAPGIRHEQGVEVRINSLGLRGPEPVMPRPDGVRRILTTGDSSVFGFGVPEEAVFSEVAALALGPGIESINAAIPGYSSYQSINLLRLRALKTEPDLIVIGNLWSDNNFDSFVDRDLLATTTGYERSPTARLQRALSISAIYRVADWKLRVSERSKKIRTVSWQVGSQQHIGLRRVAINDYAANLEILVGMADEIGAEVIFLLLANEEDVRTHVGGEKAWTPYREVMRQAAERHGAQVIEVPSLFRDSELSKDALFLDEMHPTVAGHQIMGEALAAALAPWAAGEDINAGGAGGDVPTYTDRF